MDEEATLVLESVWYETGSVLESFRSFLFGAFQYWKTHEDFIAIRFQYWKTQKNFIAVCFQYGKASENFYFGCSSTGRQPRILLRYVSRTGKVQIIFIWNVPVLEDNREFYCGMLPVREGFRLLLFWTFPYGSFQIIL